MSSRSQHYGFQSTTMVQPANGGHAYLFGNNGSENDLSEEDGESYELRPRGRERLRRSTSREKMDDIIYLTRDIQEGDTLNSIALQYHCTVRLCSHLCVSSFPAETEADLALNVPTNDSTGSQILLCYYSLSCIYSIQSCMVDECNIVRSHN